MNYPHTCSRCGSCCLIEVCPAGIDIYKLSYKEGGCPGLAFEDTIAQCGALKICQDRGMHQNIIEDYFGINKGCCVLASISGPDGRMIDIASMPPYTKTLVARTLMIKKDLIIVRKRRN